MVIDQKGSSETDSTIIQNTVLSWNFFFDIGDKWNIDGSKSTLISGFFGPFHMAEMGVYWASDNFAVNLSEGLSFIGELNNLCWTNESKIEWVEEQE